MLEESKNLYETMNKAQNEDSPQEECRKFRVSRAVNAPLMTSQFPILSICSYTVLLRLLSCITKFVMTKNKKKKQSPSAAVSFFCRLKPMPPPYVATVFYLRFFVDRNRCHIYNVFHYIARTALVLQIARRVLWI